MKPPIARACEHELVCRSWVHESEQRLPSQRSILRSGFLVSKKDEVGALFHSVLTMGTRERRKHMQCNSI